MSLPLDTEPCRQPPGAAEHVLEPGTARRRQGVAKSTYPVLAQRRQRAGIRMPTGFNFEKTPGLKSPYRQLPLGRAQFEPDFFVAQPPANNDPDHRPRSPAGSDGLDPIRSPGAVLIDTVARLQMDMEQLRSESMCNQTLGRQTSPQQPRQMTFTSTKVPKFAGVTSWEQYRQVHAIVQSNEWDDATAALQLLSHLEGDVLNVALQLLSHLEGDVLNVALQLLSHLEGDVLNVALQLLSHLEGDVLNMALQLLSHLAGDVLNVALLVPETRRATHVGSVGTLTAHYGLPGRLADYRRQFEKTTRQPEEDPSIFAIALETWR